MVGIIVYQYFFRYKAIRKDVVKPLVDATDYNTAKTKLENSIQEQTSFYPNMDVKKDFNYGEKIMMEHAKRHLDAVIDKNDPAFNESGIIKHQSDIVKSALLQTPKTDYS